MDFLDIIITAGFVLFFSACTIRPGLTLSNTQKYSQK